MSATRRAGIALDDVEGCALAAARLEVVVHGIGEVHVVDGAGAPGRLINEGNLRSLQKWGAISNRTPIETCSSAPPAMLQGFDPDGASQLGCHAFGRAHFEIPERQAQIHHTGMPGLHRAAICIGRDGRRH